MKIPVQVVVVAVLAAAFFGFGATVGLVDAQEVEPPRTESQHFNESVIVTGYTLEQIDAVPEADLEAVRAGIVRDRATASRAKRTLVDLIEAIDERMEGGESKVRRKIRARKSVSEIEAAAIE